MILPFTHDGVTGTIEVSVVRNDDPEALGTHPGSLGLPTCTATVQSAVRGYRAMMGWVQLVRSTDNRSGGSAFEMDPFALFAETESPYCFYGHLPTLFDGPSRRRRENLDWIAHAFLAASPLKPVSREVRLLAGFSWGFSIRDGEVEIRAPEPLALDDRRSHLPVLSATYPRWQFTAG